MGDEGFDFEGRIKRSDVVLLEGLNWAEESEQMLNDVSFSRPTNMQALDNFVSWEDEQGERHVGNTYAVRKLSALQGTNKHIAYFDIEKVKNDDLENDPHGIRSKLHTAHDFGESLLTAHVDGVQAEEAKLAQSMARTKHITAFEAIREWYMVAQAGLKLAEFCENKPDLLQKLREGALQAVMVVGDTHRDLIRKFQTTGIRTEASFASPPTTNAANRQIPQWISQGYIDADELRAVCSQP